ncbi:hypothetical protein CDAR_618361 [Caerostris darwini]|uniref:Uncharacterized protein n=1 Tax=Caerostris darwini TaxID=1538125 RepID=A0AAV4SUD2_9ARAC|nr:hypothetical protein CDAR_618361 [Caerostris darwini]
MKWGDVNVKSPHSNIPLTLTRALQRMHTPTPPTPFQSNLCPWFWCSIVMSSACKRGEALIPEIPNFEESGFLMTTSFWDYFVVGKAQATTIVNHVLSCEPYKKVR